MRLKKVTAKNGHVTYSIIKDYTRLDGKRTSTTHELLGDDKKLKERFGSNNTMDKVKEYISSLNKNPRLKAWFLSLAYKAYYWQPTFVGF